MTAIKVRTVITNEGSLTRWQITAPYVLTNCATTTGQKYKLPCVVRVISGDTLHSESIMDMIAGVNHTDRNQFAAKVLQNV